MYLEIIILSEVSQTKTNIIGYHLYIESKKSDTNKLIQSINRFTDRKQTYGYQGERVGGIN